MLGVEPFEVNKVIKSWVEEIKYSIVFLEPTIIEILSVGDGISKTYWALLVE